MKPDERPRYKTVVSTSDTLNSLYEHLAKSACVVTPEARELLTFVERQGIRLFPGPVEGVLMTPDQLGARSATTLFGLDDLAISNQLGMTVPLFGAMRLALELDACHESVIFATPPLFDEGGCSHYLVVKWDKKRLRTLDRWWATVPLAPNQHVIFHDLSKQAAACRS